MNSVEIIAYSENGEILDTFDATNFPNTDQYEAKYFIIGDGFVNLELSICFFALDKL